ncbi:hypothetical protein BDZ91DRAFT_798340 [Kalaharituber pfeilii]|nr:hypothetical protein BDZ91DRAFT_798340 [Kalaharituber pfeilii]
MSSTSSEGGAMTWIMDHMYTYPEKYIELPLRTTYILNSNPKLKPADFKMLMMEHIASLPSQPRSLPHSFLANFIKKCFPKDIESADFDQALTALDYLKNLEDRRKREISKVMREVGSRDVRISDMMGRMQKVDNLYSRVLVGMRQWTMIHEFQNGDFNRSNCIAMLNTLYPIQEPDVNEFLTADILAQNRQHMWKCVMHFSTSGPTILNSLKAARGGYSALCEKVHGYLRLTLDMINQCEDICRQYKSSHIVSRTSSFSFETDHDANTVSEKGSTLEKIVWQLGNLTHFRSYRRYKQSNSSVEELAVSAIHQDSDSALFYD